MKWLKRLQSTLSPNNLQRDLDDELQLHGSPRPRIDGAGHAAQSGATRSQQRFGNRTLMKERARDRDIVGWLESLFQDLRYAARALRRDPGLAATAILSLALGIGANAALFSIMDALLLKQLPVRDPKSLLTLQQRNPKCGTGTFSYDVFDSIGERAGC